MYDCRSLIQTIALSCLVFKKIAFYCRHFGDRQTDGQAQRVKPLSLSPAAACNTLRNVFIFKDIR